LNEAYEKLLLFETMGQPVDLLLVDARTPDFSLPALL